MEGFAVGATFCPVRVIVGGGRTPGRLGPSGSFPMPLLYNGWCSWTLGTFTELLRCSSDGFPVYFIGVAVIGALPT